MQLIQENVDTAVAEFKRQHGLHHVIAFSGGASTDMPGVPVDDPLQKDFSSFQQKMETRLVTDVLNILRHYRVALLSGGTKFGFPKVAMEMAQKFGMKTIGVFPQTAFNKGYVINGIDLPICVGPHFGESVWGDESGVFAKLLDAVIVVGGGAGTLIEVSHLLKMNEGLLKYDKPLKLIIPIDGTGGVADGLHFVWGKQDTKNACLPSRPIKTGTDAGKYIEEHVDLLNL